MKHEAEEELFAQLKEHEFIIKLRQKLVLNFDNNKVQMRSDPIMNHRASK